MVHSIKGKFTLEMIGLDPIAMENAASVIYKNLPKLYPESKEVEYEIDITGLKEGHAIPKNSRMERNATKEMRDPIVELKAAQSTAFKTRGPRALEIQRNWIMSAMLQYLMGFLSKDDALIAYIKLEEMTPEKLMNTLKPQMFYFFLYQLN